ncbi:MAG TPA: alpha/beta fold hydrolase [Burkholderiaceae bacterium]
MSRLFAILLLCSLGAGKAVAQIPTPRTFGHLSNFGSQLSADGRYLLRVQRNAGRMAVIASHADGSDPVYVVKPEENLAIYFAQWARDANRVVVSAGGRGSGLEMAYLYDMESGRRTDLLATLRAPEALYVSASPRDNLAFPIAIYRDVEKPAQKSLFQLDLSQGSLRPLIREGDVIPFSFGACPDLQFGLRFDGEAGGAAMSYLVKLQGKWHDLRRIDGASRAAGTALASCSAEHHEVYFLDADARDFVALASYDLDSLQLKSVSADNGDIASILFDRRSGAPLFYTAMYDRPQTTAMGEADERFLAEAGQRFTDGFELLSRSADGSAYLLSGAMKEQADAVYLWRDGKFAPLYFGRDDLAAWHVLPQLPQAIKARDGVALTAYLTMPADMCPGTGCKTVLLVHGGPGERDSVHADPVVQWLAAHGYMVLTVNFRGSHGAGRALEALGRREWGGRMQDDLDDAAHWAIGHGLADPKRIAIMGGSYGGYAALEAVLRENHPYACAFSMSGMTDLAEFVKQRVRTMPEMEGDLVAQIGDPNDKADRAVLAARSPMESAAHLNVPLLLTGVEDDPIVPLEGTLDFARKLEQAGKAASFSLFVYKGKGHMFNNAANERLNWLLAERFLGACLDGKPGNLNDDLRDARFAQRLDGLHLLP